MTVLLFIGIPLRSLRDISPRGRAPLSHVWTTGMRKPPRYLFVWLWVVLLLFLAGCATYKAQKIPLAQASGGLKNEVLLTVDSIEVRCVSLGKEEDCQTYFGVDSSADMLPVLVRIRNDTGNPLKVNLSSSYLITSSGARCRLLSLEESFGRARRGEGSVEAAAVAFGVTGVLVSGSQTAKANRSLEQDYHEKYFKPTLINTGGQGEGVLFFDVAGIEDVHVGSLTITLLDVSTNETRELRIELQE